ncbi:S24 family peptidase [Aliihoeflea sp. 2WW]|uniref:S24 family peptidase n=1 Tax=Aliihoeflea sp. 2WW TaxID=1381123 RepID=UPI001FCB3394|nr:S24 family peptidase [Aliihoeflea sp. 2WW]
MLLSPVTISTLIHRREYRFVSISVPAGFPSPAGDDFEDSIDPFGWIVRHEAFTYWRVSGDSLMDLGIVDGDFVAVDRAGKLRHGRIVVAIVDGCVDRQSRRTQRRPHLARAQGQGSGLRTHLGRREHGGLGRCCGDLPQLPG